MTDDSSRTILRGRFLSLFFRGRVTIFVEAVARARIVRNLSCMSNADSILAQIADLTAAAERAQQRGDKMRLEALLRDILQLEDDYRACEG